MRPIKFRAWDKIEMKMFFGSNLMLDGHGHLFWQFGQQLPEVLVRDQYEIMFFTGLHDKNGKEIWEGDVVEIQEYKGKKFRGKIIFNIDTGRFCFSDYDGIMWGLKTRDKFNEKIGNIYEHPELLKSEGVER